MSKAAASIVLMGVTGSGKSTIGTLLAQELGWEYLECDDFHPRSNKDKMAAGNPLTDEDRKPWLESLNQLLLQKKREGTPVVLSCSALKSSYRDMLRCGLSDLQFVHLDGSLECIQKRLSERKGHFMNPDLLHSQFADLEPSKSAIRVSIEGTPALIVEEILRSLDSL